MPDIILRDYQEADLAAIRAAFTEHQRVLLTQPTGSGKGTLAAYIVRASVARGSKVLFLVNRRALVNDMSARLHKLGIDHGVIMGQDKARRKAWLPVQVASIDTLHRRPNVPAADLLIVDECLEEASCVAMADGTQKPIKDVKPGDKVTSYNTESGEYEADTVYACSKATHKDTLTIRTADGLVVECTGNHPFLTEHGWRKAEDLTCGDRVLKLSPSVTSPVRRSASSVERFSVTCPSRTQGPECEPLPSTATTVPSRKSGPNTKHEGSPSLTHARVSERIADTGVSISGFTPEYISDWSQSLISFVRTQAVKQSQGNGLKWLRLKVWRGGLWTTDQTRSTKRVIRSLSYIRKGFQSESKKSWSSGLVIKDTGRAHTKPRVGTGFYHSSKALDESGSGISPNFRSPAWVTSSSIVVNVSRNEDRCVCNLGVLKNQNFIANSFIVHNCRFAVSDTWRSVLDRYPDASILGLDATPERADGRGLGEVFQRIVHGPQVQQLIDKGHLMPSVLMQLPAPDMSGVKNTEASLANAVDKGVLIGDVVDTWLKYAADHKTVVFAVNQEHANHLAEGFRSKGVDCAYVDCNTDDTPGGDRDKIWKDLDEGSLRVICSVATISYGWDHPIVSCIVGARPVMKSVADWLQSIGRGSRPHPASGKTHFRIHDHGGNTERLDVLYEDDRIWDLEGRALKVKEKDNVPAIRNCSVCFRSFRSTRDTCPHCGAIVQKSQREIAQMQAELMERKREARRLSLEQWKAQVSGDPNKKAYYLQLCEVAHKKGYRPGWPMIQFKTKHGHWPPKEWTSEAKSLGILPEPRPMPPMPPSLPWELLE